MQLASTVVPTPASPLASSSQTTAWPMKSIPGPPNSSGTPTVRRPDFVKLLHHLPGELVPLVKVDCMGGDLLIGKFPCHVLHGFLFLGQMKTQHRTSLRTRIRSLKYRPIPSGSGGRCPPSRVIKAVRPGPRACRAVVAVLAETRTKQARRPAATEGRRRNRSSSRMVGGGSSQASVGMLSLKRITVAMTSVVRHPGVGTQRREARPEDTRTRLESRRRQAFEADGQPDVR